VPYAHTSLFRAAVRDHMGAKPVELARTASLEEVVRGVAESPFVVVIDSFRRPAGIVTAKDVVRRVTWRATPDQPVEAVMTSPVVTVAAGDHLLPAITTMRRHGFDRVPVVDETGRLVGMLGLQDALLSLLGCARRLIDELVPDAGLDTLQRVKASEIEIVRQLLDEDTPATTAMALLTEINLELHRRALALAIDGLAADGWGAPPVAFALVIMGAAGRGECLLAPDQDNGFILADYEDDAHGRIDSYFVPLAVRFTRLLAEIGVPGLCRQRHGNQPGLAQAHLRMAPADRDLAAKTHGDAAVAERHPGGFSARRGRCRAIRGAAPAHHSGDRREPEFRQGPVRDRGAPRGGARLAGRAAERARQA
jgi:signal-transduction protein with cAMP-binding, CBS, and nucleotidyltransferase domain